MMWISTSERSAAHDREWLVTTCNPGLAHNTQPFFRVKSRFWHARFRVMISDTRPIVWLWEARQQTFHAVHRKHCIFDITDRLEESWPTVHTLCVKQKWVSDMVEDRGSMAFSPERESGPRMTCCTVM